MHQTSVCTYPDNVFYMQFFITIYKEYGCEQLAKIPTLRVHVQIYVYLEKGVFNDNYMEVFGGGKDCVLVCV